MRKTDKKFYVVQILLPHKLFTSCSKFIHEVQLFSFHAQAERSASDDIDFSNILILLRGGCMMTYTQRHMRWGLMAGMSAAVCLGSFGTAEALADTADEVLIELSDETILVDGQEISTDGSDAVYAGADIIYYEADQESTYGAGDENDSHSAEEAEAHTVITITEAGTYRVTGTLSAGQIAVDLGEEAEEDEEAAVTLILDNADITCTVAPAIMVYSAYECGSDDTESASSDVDTSNAGFTLMLADDSENIINGSYVAKIYKEGTTQEEIDSGEAKKAWKMDAAIESFVSLNITAEEEGTGSMTVNADNEGIESALHLTIDGGNITINSADDAVNASEDGVSVLTINDGTIIANAGSGIEGDGMDSNGWIVINGGYVIASANGNSQDSGVDSDMGIQINGGTVLASGNMYDEISSESAQQYVVLSFSEKQSAGQILMLKDSDGQAVTAFYAENDFTTLVYASGDLAEGDYTLYTVTEVNGDQDGTVYTNITDYQGEQQLAYSSTAIGGFGGAIGGMTPGQMPEGMNEGERPEMPEGMNEGERPEMPEGMSEGEMPEMPEGISEGEMPEMPEGMNEGERPEMPGNAEGTQPDDGQPGGTEGMPQAGGSAAESGELQTVFTITAGGNAFSQITAAQTETD